MESIAYLICEKFALVAVDTNYVFDLKEFEFVHTQAQKVYKLNDHNMISVIGNQYKITDINKYILKLNELGHNTTYEQIKEDLNYAFGSSKIDTAEELGKLAEILPKFYNETGHIKLNELYEYLENQPELISLLKDTIPKVNDDATTAITQIFLFGWEKAMEQLKFVRYISIGQNLTEFEVPEFPIDQVYIGIASASVDANATRDLELEIVQDLTPLMLQGWQSNNDLISEVIEKGKEVLSEGIRRICPFKIKPNIAFYEISHRTGFVFEEPALKLSKIEYSR